MNETDKLVEAQFNRLPSELQKALEAVPWKSSVKEIALLNDIPLERVSDIERETMFILYQFENPEDYVANLMRETGIREDVATSIAQAVDEKIFKAIADKAAELSNPQPAPAAAPMEEAHENLPMVEAGEVAHEVPHVEEKPMAAPAPTPVPAVSETKVPQEKPKIPEKPAFEAPKSDYPGGKDPYREPLV